MQFSYEDSYLEMQSADLEQEFNVTFTLITDADFGVLLYHGSKSRPHLAVELFKGRVRVSFDVGANEPTPSMTTMYTYAKVNDRKMCSTFELVMRDKS